MRFGPERRGWRLRVVWVWTARLLVRQARRLVFVEAGRRDNLKGSLLQLHCEVRVRFA